MSDETKFGQYCPALEAVAVVADAGDSEPAKLQKLSPEESAEVSLPRGPVDHYMRGGIECIDAMKAISTKEEFVGHLRLTALKYLWRLGEKDDPVREAKKAMDYAVWLYEELKGAE